MKITREDIVREARALVGTPFRHQGFDPATGIDCRGHLLCIASALRYPLLQDYRHNYRRKPDSAEFRAALVSELDEIPLDDARDGDLLFIRLPREEKPTHVGIIYTGRYEMMIVHARGNGGGQGAVVEDPLRRWKDYLVEAFRFRGLED